MMFSMPKAHVELCLEIDVLFDDFLLIQGPIYGEFQLLVDQWLGEKIERSGADGFDCRFDRTVSGDHDNCRFRMVLPAMFQDLESVALAQANVGQHNFVVLMIDSRDGFRHAGGRV